ncbi:MAG: Hpt domain-containing protein [Planctomycetia bacterium]|nr:Hpt domain-containing protein [Planctomycetia bacterium]
MNAQTTLPRTATREPKPGCSLADVLSLVEVDECRRAADSADAHPWHAAAESAGPSRESAHAALDLMSLLGRCLGNIDLILRVLASFRNAGHADLARLEQAIAQADFATVIEVAHRFKGAAGNVSAPGLRKIAMSLELLGREQNGVGLELALTQLRSEWQEFVRCADAFAPAVSVPAAGPAGTIK